MLRNQVRETTISLRLALVTLFGIMTYAAWAQSRPEVDLSAIQMNQIQVIGTHNSYHVRPSNTVMAVAKRVSDETKTWDYSHAPLNEQLDRGVRSFELDLHNKAAGYAVFHVPFVDANSTCATLVDCMLVVRDWSDAHPGHVPILLLFEIKDDLAALDSNIQPIDAGALDKLDNEVVSVFGLDKLITPDEVRRGRPTLEWAVLELGWPSLAETRGRVMAVLHEDDRIRDLYCEGRPSLEGRAMFTRSEPGRADAAVLVEDDPSVERIQRLVQAGYLVRTRADSGLYAGGLDRRDAALASGAQVISTDFPMGEACLESGYIVAFHGAAPFRCNPVNAPTECSLGSLEAVR